MTSSGASSNLGRHRKLGQILLETGLISQEQLDRALAAQRGTRQRLGHVLTSLGIVTDQQIAAVLSDQLSLPLIDLSQHETDQSALSRLSRELATRYTVFPLKLDGASLTLVMGDPLNIEAEDAVRSATGLDVRPAVASESQVLEYLMRHYSEKEEAYELLDQITAESGDDVISISDTASNPRELLEASGIDSVIRAVNAILGDAVKRAASDIHLEPYDQAVRLRYRLDGRLRQIAHLPLAAYPAVVSRIKVLANLDISENRRSQDGSFKATVGVNSVSFRISTLRTGSGEKVVIRILDNSMRKVGLGALGLQPADRERLEALIANPQGMVLVTGPTGSGKTTTLYAAINQLKSDEVNIVTVEDPIEYQLGSINQVQVDEKAGITFASALRSILRQDPNVIMLGEIRDGETAEIATRAAMTGHLVLATLHANFACAAPARLIDLGIEPYLLGVSLNGVLAQRLVRRLCPHCSQELHRPIGCKYCSFTGYAGRIGLYELLVVDSDVRDAINRRSTADELEAIARRRGFRGMAEDGHDKRVLGWTTQEQIAAVLGATTAEHGDAPSAPRDRLPVDPESDRTLDAEPAVDSEPTVGSEAPSVQSVAAEEPAAPGLHRAVAPARDDDRSSDSDESPPTASHVVAPERETALRPVIRVQIDANRIRLVAVTPSDVLAAQTYNQGVDTWLGSLSTETGIPNEKLAVLLQTLAVDGASPFAPAVERVVSPLARAIQSTRDLFSGRDREDLVVQIKWDAKLFPGLLEALHAHDPSLRIEPLASVPVH